MSEWIKRLTERYSEVTENQKAALQKKLAKSAASSEKGKQAVSLPKAPFEIPKDDNKQEMSSKEKMKKGLYNSKMDPVDKKELKGKHADRDDKDIDNDGDVDASDEYLHKRRKAITKNTKSESLRKRIEMKMKGKDKDEIVMNPKSKKDDAQMSQESVEWKVYDRILENRAAHYKGATAPQDADDNIESPTARAEKKKMDAQKNVNDDDIKGASDDVKKAGQAGPNGKARSNDNKSGDKAIINKPEDITKKGEG